MLSIIFLGSFCRGIQAVPVPFFFKDIMYHFLNALFEARPYQRLWSSGSFY